jgi:hypothetical protein
VTVTIARAMMGRQKKEGNQFPSSNKLVQEPEGNKQIWILRSRFQQNKDKLWQRTQ